MARLELERLRKSYGQVDVVGGVSLAIAEGELVSLLGPSGCGKTTILRMVAGLLEPSGGTVRVAGKDITRTPVARRDIGLVFQSYALFPHMTVFENVAFGLRRRGEKGGRLAERVTEALDMVQLAHLADRFPRQLSGGQQQRVALARAIAPRPRLLLFDEPLSNLDAQLRGRMQIELKQLQKELGITSVFVTHDQSEAMTLSDRICILAKGRIQQFSKPETIYRDPANAFVATFIGRSNTYAGTVRHGTIAIGGAVALPVRNAGAAEGTKVEAVIRYEDVAVLPAGAPDSLSARVRLRSFIGARVQYVADLAPGVAMVAEVDAAGAGGAFEPGEEIGLRVDMERAFVAPVEVAGA